VSVEDLRVTVNSVRRGAGPPLLLLHGIGHRWQAWEPVLDRLAEVHDVIALDLPGFGESPMPADGAPLDMRATIARFPALLAELGVDRPHVAGNSLGGSIALELAAAGLAASATALSPAGFFTAAERRRALAILAVLRANTFLPAQVVRAVLRSEAMRAVCFGRLVAHPTRLSVERAVGDALAMRRGKAYRPVARAGRGYQFTGTPEVPVTVAWGTKDRILLPREAERARARLPRARHVELPGCGHVPMSDDPELVASVILATTMVAGAGCP
jgi:pimeloyl-ACP methyl ester carboxylesterase